MSVASGAVALSLSSSLCTSDTDMLFFNAMAASLFGGLMRAMKVNGVKPSSNGRLLVCFIIGVNALIWAPSSSAHASYVSPVPVSSTIDEPRDVALSDIAQNSHLVVPFLLLSTITASRLSYIILNCKAILALALTMVIGTIMSIFRFIRPYVSGLLAVFATIFGFLLRQLVAGAVLLYSSVFPRFKLHVLFGNCLWQCVVFLESSTYRFRRRHIPDLIDEVEHWIWRHQDAFCSDGSVNYDQVKTLKVYRMHFWQEVDNLLDIGLMVLTALVAVSAIIVVCQMSLPVASAASAEHLPQHQANYLWFVDWRLSVPVFVAIMVVGMVRSGWRTVFAEFCSVLLVMSVTYLAGYCHGRTSALSSKPDIFPVKVLVTHAGEERTGSVVESGTPRLLNFEDVPEAEEEKEETKPEISLDDSDSEPLLDNSDSEPICNGEHHQPILRLGLHNRSSSAYSHKFWSSFVDHGGKPWKSMYSDINTRLSNPNLLPPRLTEWCIAMSERLLPWCQACRDRVRPSVSQSKRNPGAVYYSCTLCPPRNNYFRWASDLWSCMYRTWLDKQRIRCIDEHDKEQWIPVSDSVVPDVVDQAHTVFESTVLMGTPQVRRPVSKHMFLFTICTCVVPVESSAVPSVSVFKYLDALDYDYWIGLQFSV